MDGSVCISLGNDLVATGLIGLDGGVVRLQIKSTADYSILEDSTHADEAAAQTRLTDFATAQGWFAEWYPGVAPEGSFDPTPAQGDLPFTMAFEGTAQAVDIHDTANPVAIPFTQVSIDPTLLSQSVDELDLIALTDLRLIVQCSLFTGSGANNRNIYRLVYERRAADDSPIREWRCGTQYIRDDNNAYDSAEWAGERSIFLAAGEKLRVFIVTVDVQTASAVVPLDAAQSKITVERP